MRIDPQTLEPRFRVIGSEVWSDEDEFAAATAGVGITGICGSGIIEVVAEMFLAGIISADGVIDGALAGRSPRIVAMAERSPTCCTRARSRFASPRTTCARSSSPRPRCTPVYAC